ncbi:MAG: SCP2 sterol-binding domain-containing protein [Defluviitaleaceae bacterium]|nr:SCP2 sterol-binding domain-containing protein [Defluviitaleaceae bacterium]
MKITLLRACAEDRDFGLSKLLQAVAGVLTELGLEIDEIDLNDPEIPFFAGRSDGSGKTAEIFANIRASAGIVIAASAPLRMIYAAALRFLEYLRLPECGSAFAGKNCMLIVAAPDDGGEAEALEYLSRALSVAGAFDSVRIGLREGAADLENNAENKEIVEKQTEDFYRYVRQNRKFIVPKPWERLQEGMPFTKTEISPPAMTVSEIYEKLGIDENDTGRDEEIREIARLFDEKYSQHNEEGGRASGVAGEAGRVAGPLAGPDNPAQRAKGKTCRELTEALPGRFNPKEAQELAAAIVVSVSGAEAFEGWLDIRNTKCAYRAGRPDTDPDMTILADAAAWGDVLMGRFSAQKAFMTGRLKVRGNFALLRRFDRLFGMKGE